jgi:hypothetical protein
MTSFELCQALWDSRASFNVPYVVFAGVGSKLFDAKQLVSRKDIENNHAAPPLAFLL